MKNTLITLLIFAHIITIQAQDNIRFIDLPAEFDAELEISGMTGHNDTLYFAAERYNKILIVNEKDYSLIKTIELVPSMKKYNQAHPENKIGINKVEMEGMCWYKNTLLLVDEGNTAIYQFCLQQNSIKKLETNLDLTDFYRSNGMEGIAVNPEKKLVYILRERNGNNQSEIYTLHITDDFKLKYKQEKLAINHPNNNWRYTGIYFDGFEKKMYALRSFYDRSNPENAKCFVDHIPLHSGELSDNSVIFNKDEKLSRLVIKNRCKYVSNLEGIYKNGNKILMVSDNNRNSKNCDNVPIKTMFIEYLVNE